MVSQDNMKTAVLLWMLSEQRVVSIGFTREQTLFPAVHASTPPFIHVKIPSFETVMTAASEVKATCSVNTVLKAKVTWQLDGRNAPTNTVRMNSNATHIVSDVTVSSSAWKQLRLIKCKAEHRCFTSTEKTVNVAGKITIHHENQQCWDSNDLKEHIVICFMSFLSRSNSYNSIGGDQEIFPTFAKGGERGAWVWS